jgi:hypothetical protein
VKGLDVNVDVKDGVVTLSGSVDTMAQRASAGKIAQGVDGAKKVENRLAIKPAKPADDQSPLPGPKSVPPAPPAN